jgi:hypothetical protein
MKREVHNVQSVDRAQEEDPEFRDPINDITPFNVGFSKNIEFRGSLLSFSQNLLCSSLLREKPKIEIETDIRIAITI